MLFIRLCHNFRRIRRGWKSYIVQQKFYLINCILSVLGYYLISFSGISHWNRLIWTADYAPEITVFNKWSWKKKLEMYLFNYSLFVQFYIIHEKWMCVWWSNYKKSIYIRKLISIDKRQLHLSKYYIYLILTYASFILIFNQHGI